MKELPPLIHKPKLEVRTYEKMCKCKLTDTKYQAKSMERGGVTFDYLVPCCETCGEPWKPVTP